MADFKKKGKCTNFSAEGHKGCPKADADEIIEVDITDDFVCPHCHSELMEIHEKPGVPKWIWAVVAAAVVLVGGGGALWICGVFDKEPEPIVIPVQPTEPESEVEPEAAPVDEQEPEVKAEAPAEPVKPAYPTVGTFSGSLKNGFPHGTGTLTFKQSRLIDAHDEKGRTAAPGDYIIGEWDNGHLIQGRWYDASNTLKETIVLGKAMNPEKDHSLGRFGK